MHRVARRTTTGAEIAPLSEEHLAAAAALLAGRHAHHRAQEPLLADVDAAAAVRDALGRQGAAGLVAVRDGAVAGFMIGRPAASDVWPPHAYVDPAGHAGEDAEITRDLYAALSERWSQAGIAMHLARVPMTSRDLDPWYRLGFAQMQVDAIREPGGDGAPVPEGVIIRRGSLDDLDAIVDTQATLIWEHQRKAPVFTGITVPDRRSLREAWSEWEPDDVLFVAERDGRMVGHSLLYPAPPELGVPERSLRLASSAVVPAERGSGLGVALTEQGFAWAADAGYAAVTTDWRVTNLMASRFWPARGFRPTFVRMMRVIGTG
jgi:GNAT superfamily N-acetyltransferase